MNKNISQEKFIKIIKLLDNEKATETEKKLFLNSLQQNWQNLEYQKQEFYFHILEKIQFFPHEKSLVAGTDLLIKFCETTSVTDVHIVPVGNSSEPFTYKYKQILRENNISLNESADTIIFYDDFSGTGQSIIEKKKELSANDSKIYMAIIPLVTEHAKNELEKENIEVYCKHEHKKAITGTPLDNPDNRNFIEYMSKELKIPDELHFGFGHTEASLKLSRTPNNTIPILYWEDRTNKQEKQKWKNVLSPR